MKQHAWASFILQAKKRDSSDKILLIRLEISLKQGGESNLLCWCPVMAHIAWNKELRIESCEIKFPIWVDKWLGQAHSCLFLRDSASYWKMVVTNTIQLQHLGLISMSSFFRPTPCCSSMSSKQRSMLKSLVKSGWIKHLRPRNLTETILNQLNNQLINQFWSCCTKLMLT